MKESGGANEEALCVFGPAGTDSVHVSVCFSVPRPH